ncbi:M24 family metallopeptidase [Mesorhizobium abyssinicae]|uniref:M24 family metallopeptidase n=1 Tax=Mesorhizobium abyssinicae TaxID=1209958 RepID=UPI002A248774|nr:M24 family metallopeptidase [Mesorhizobium abyssinicae]MDX8437287.1 M24 family metallopeptidase [Mesorhizobium abyssinicae]
MTTAELRFEVSEYQERLAKTQKAMEQAGVDLLIVTDPANIGWLTGYDGWSFYVHQCAIVRLDGPPIWFGRKMDVNGAKRTTYMGEECIKFYEDHYVQSDDFHPMTVLGQLITSSGWGSSTIGIEMDVPYLTHAAFEALEASLPNVKFKNTTRLVKWQRIVKSAREMEYMRGAGKIITAIYERIEQILRPGLRQNDLVAEICDAGIRGVDGFWGDYPAAFPLIGAGANAAAPHLTWTDRPIMPHESIFFELAGVYKRYHVPLSRTFYLGKPPQKILDAEKAVLEGMEAGFEQLVPGKTCEGVALAFFNELARHGLKKEGRTGYSIGMAYPPGWGEASASFRKGDHTELKPGMCFHFMSGLWYGDWGIEITESLMITEGKPEVLSNSPRKLIIIE